MSASSLPSLPMDLPELATPSSPSRTAGRRGAPRTAPAPAASSTDVQMIVVEACHLTIDERFGMDVVALTKRYAPQVAEARERISSATGQSTYPHVIRLDDGRYAAVTELPIALAAIELANDPTTLGPLLTVVLLDKVDGEALLSTVFCKQQARSLWEKARYIAACETRYRTRREWMRAESISTGKWEPRLSKIAKVGKLDKSLLALVDPHTISNADVAGRIVDAWDDFAKRATIMAMTETAAVSSGGVANAGSLFKRIDAALSDTKPDFVAGEWVEGARDLRRADGAVVATIKRDSTGWSIAGTDLTAITRSALSSALEALTS